MRALLVSLLCTTLCFACGVSEPSKPLEGELELRLEVRVESEGAEETTANQSASFRFSLVDGTPLADRVELEDAGVKLHLLGMGVEGDQVFFRGWGYKGELGLDGPVADAYKTETTGHESEREHTALVTGTPVTGVITTVHADDGPTTVVRYELWFTRP